MAEYDSTHFFFFQAEDGIRDGHVTGVQTCALPISGTRSPSTVPSVTSSPRTPMRRWSSSVAGRARSEERRVGKECRWGWEEELEKKKEHKKTRREGRMGVE